MWRRGGEAEGEGAGRREIIAQEVSPHRTHQLQYSGNYVILNNVWRRGGGRGEIIAEEVHVCYIE